MAGFAASIYKIANLLHILGNNIDDVKFLAYIARKWAAVWSWAHYVYPQANIRHKDPQETKKCGSGFSTIDFFKDK